MTCIVGLEAGGNIYIGADSAATSGLALCVRADAKVFRNGPFLIGFTTSFRMGQLLQFKLQPPDHPAGMSTFEFLVTLFVDRVRSCLRTGGFAKRKEEQELAGSFLLGYRGSLYSMDSDYQIARAADGISAVGCGAHIALGALHALNAIAPLNPDKPKGEVTFRTAESVALMSENHHALSPAGITETTMHQTLTPHKRLEIALDAAQRWNSAVRSPFVILSN
jgi:ATP-dependent protease HslVU (ClpYQ) peptidase subunit